MTIAVQVKNCESEGGRTVRVTEMSRTKDGTPPRKGKEITDLSPGESRTFHIHMLKDLIVEEREP